PPSAACAHWKISPTRPTRSWTWREAASANVKRRSPSSAVFSRRPDWPRWPPARCRRARALCRIDLPESVFDTGQVSVAPQAHDAVDRLARAGLVQPASALPGGSVAPAPSAPAPVPPADEPLPVLPALTGLLP